MKKLVLLSIFASIFSFGTVTFAQEEADNGYNPLSVNPIHDSQIMFKKRIWRRMDLEEKQNAPFFINGNGVVKIIIDAVENGILTPYENDSLLKRMSKEDFRTNLQDPAYTVSLSDEEEAFDLQEDDGWDWDTPAEPSTEDTEELEEEVAVNAGGERFLNKQISVLEIMEDLIFDKQRSRIYYDILAVNLIIPASRFDAGIYRKVASFKYKDLVEIFRSMPDEAIWYNPQNDAEHKNLADAFALRLFSARIVKIGNPDDKMVQDVYDQSLKAGLLGSIWEEHKLLEYESELWSY